MLLFSKGNQFLNVDDSMFAPATKVLNINDWAKTIEAQKNARIELFDAAVKQGELVENFNSSLTARDQSYTRRIEAIHEATGVRLRHPFNEDVDRHILNGPKYRSNPQQYYKDRVKTFELALASLSEKFPEHSEIINGFGQSIDQEAQAASVTANSNFENAVSNPALRTRDRLTAVIGGGLIASLKDPVQIATLFLGGAPGAGRTVAARVAQVAATEAAINAGLETVLQAKAADYKNRIGIEHTVGDTLRNVGVAALFGVGFGGGIQAGREIFDLVSVGSSKNALKSSPEATQAVHRAFAGELKPDDEKSLVEGLAAVLQRNLRPDEQNDIAIGFEMDQLDQSYLDGARKAFDVAAESEEAADVLAQAALRHAEDPDLYPPPEMLEAQLAEREAFRVFRDVDEYVEGNGLNISADPVLAAADHAEARYSLQYTQETIDPLQDRQIAPPPLSRPVTTVDEAAGETTNDAALPDFGEISPEIKESLDDAIVKAGEIPERKSKSVSELIAVNDNQGNVKLITAREALEDAQQGAAMADVLEACKL
ncbi:MAG: hypothetical protein AAF478_03475 [Pseudomonadota bacterium]